MRITVRTRLIKFYYNSSEGYQIKRTTELLVLSQLLYRTLHILDYEVDSTNTIVQDNYTTLLQDHFVTELYHYNYAQTTPYYKTPQKYKWMIITSSSTLN